MTTADTAASQKTTARPKCKSLRSRWADLGLAIGLAVIVAVGVFFISRYAINKPIPWPWFLAVWLPALLIFYVRLRATQILNWAESWPTFSWIANSRAAQVLTAAFSLVPMVVAVAKGVGLQQQLPFTVYLYWISGLMMFLFLLIFKFTAPAVYRYKSYKELLECEGGLQILREDLSELKQLAKDKLAPFDDAQKHDFMDQDIEDIERLRATDRTEGPELYFLMRKYSAWLKRTQRGFLTPLLAIPIYVLITTTATNTVLVGIEAAEQVRCHGGLIQNIYRGILSLDSSNFTMKPSPVEGCPETPDPKGFAPVIINAEHR